MSKYPPENAAEYYLLTPGPTPTPESVRLAMAAQLIHHRTPQFSEIFSEAQQGLQWLFQTEEIPLILTCSGTGAFEACLQTFTVPGDHLLAIGGGKFGERWGLMGRRLALDVTDIEVEWGRCVTEEQLRRAFSTGKKVDVVTVSASETSTGVLHDVEMIVRVVREVAPDALVGVDAVTALGVQDLPFDTLDLDFMISGSQKALALPPGLAFAVASERAWDRAATDDAAGKSRRSFYFDLVAERKKQAKSTTCFTPAITLVIGLVEVLKLFKEEGLQQLFLRHQKIAEYCRASVQDMGCKLFAETPSNAVTAAVVPDGISAPEVVRRLESDYKIKIAGGQDHLKDKLIRIGHLGFIEYSEVVYAMFMLRELLGDLS